MGGVSPGKGGQIHLDLPVFNTVREVCILFPDTAALTAAGGRTSQAPCQRRVCARAGRRGRHYRVDRSRGTACRQRRRTHSRARHAARARGAADTKPDAARRAQLPRYHRARAVPRGHHAVQAVHEGLRGHRLQVGHAEL